MFEGRRATGIRYRKAARHEARCHAKCCWQPAPCSRRSCCSYPASVRRRCCSNTASMSCMISGRRREPAGPSADPPDLRMHQAHHHQRPAALAARAHQDRPAVADRTPWPAGDRHQPRRLLHARAGRVGRHPTSSSTSRRCRPTWPAARCIRSRASRCRSASCAPNRAAASRSVHRSDAAAVDASQLPDRRDDRRTAVAGMRAARAIAQSAPMRPYVAREVNPGATRDDDAALLEFARNNGATISTHPARARWAMTRWRSSMRACACTASNGLRVVDCSVMPTLVPATPMRRR